MLFVQIIFIAHLLGCIWWGLGILMSEPGHAWMDDPYGTHSLTLPLLLTHLTIYSLTQVMRGWMIPMATSTALSVTATSSPSTCAASPSSSLPWRPLVLTHSPNYLLTHSLTHSPNHLLTYSPRLWRCPGGQHLRTDPHNFYYVDGYSLTHLTIYSLTHSPNHLLTHSLTHLTIYSLTYSLTHLLTHSLT